MEIMGVRRGARHRFPPGSSQRSTRRRGRAPGPEDLTTAYNAAPQRRAYRAAGQTGWAQADAGGYCFARLRLTGSHDQSPGQPQCGLHLKIGAPHDREHYPRHDERGSLAQSVLARSDRDPRTGTRRGEHLAWRASHRTGLVVWQSPGATGAVTLASSTAAAQRHRDHPLSEWSLICSALLALYGFETLRSETDQIAWLPLTPQRGVGGVTRLSDIHSGPSGRVGPSRSRRGCSRTAGAAVRDQRRNRIAGPLRVSPHRPGRRGPSRVRRWSGD